MSEGRWVGFNGDYTVESAELWITINCECGNITYLYVSDTGWSECEHCNREYRMNSFRVETLLKGS